MPFPVKPLNYRSFLLRFWQEPGHSINLARWRFSVEDPHTGERQGFVNLESLVTFLQGQIARFEPLSTALSVDPARSSNGLKNAELKNLEGVEPNDQSHASGT